MHDFGVNSDALIMHRNPRTIMIPVHLIHDAVDGEFGHEQMSIRITFAQNHVKSMRYASSI